MKYKKHKGFTLVELMIVLAILSIVSAIAIPSYATYVRKAKRTEAKSEILEVAQLQERYYVQNLTYAASATGLGFSSDSITTETGLYTVTVTGAAAISTDTCDGTSTVPCVSYIIEAIPVAGAQQASDDCVGFRLSNTGLKQAKISTDSDWTSTTSRDECWN